MERASDVLTGSSSPFSYGSGSVNPMKKSNLIQIQSYSNVNYRNVNPTRFKI